MSNMINFDLFQLEMDMVETPMSIAFPIPTEDGEAWKPGPETPCSVKWCHGRWVVEYGEGQFEFKDEQVEWLTNDRDGRVAVEINKDNEASEGEVGQRATLYRGFKYNEVPEDYLAESNEARQTLLTWLLYSEELAVGGYGHKLVGDVLLLSHRHGGTARAVDLSSGSSEQIRIKVEVNDMVVAVYTSTYSRRILEFFCSRK